MSDIAAAHAAAPFVSVYPWSSGFGTKHSDPSTLPTNTCRGVAFSPDGTDIAVAHHDTPYISAYPWSSGFGTKYSNPSTLPANTGFGVAFSPDGADIAVTYWDAPNVSAYQWASGFGTKYSDPSVSLPGFGRNVTFSPDGADIAVAHYGSPYISVYPWSSGFGTKYSNPSTLPSQVCWGVAFSPDGADIAVAHQDSPFISTYPWSSGFGTKYSNPSTLPVSNAQSVAFSPDGADIAVVYTTTPFVSTYPWSSGFGTKYSNPSTLPSGTSLGVAFSSDGADIAVAHAGTPNISTYQWSSGFGTKYSDPSTLPTSTSLSVAFSFLETTASSISASYGSYDSAGPDNTPWTLNFTGGGDIDHYEVRTASGGGGTQVINGAAASGANAKTIAYNAPGLAVTTGLTLYLRVSSDGGSTWDNEYEMTTIFLRDDTVVNPSVDSHNPDPVTGPTAGFTVQFDAADAGSPTADGCAYEINDDSAGAGTNRATGNFTQGLNRTSDTTSGHTLSDGANTWSIRVRNQANKWSGWVNFTVTASVNPTAVITGTTVPAVLASDVVAGGKTIIITLTGDTWIDA